MPDGYRNLIPFATDDAFYELLDDGTWAKWELQPTSNGFELIQVDDCDADEVPGGALVG